jgi:hypothetical protein
MNLLFSVAEALAELGQSSLSGLRVSSPPRTLPIAIGTANFGAFYFYLAEDPS